MTSEATNVAAVDEKLPKIRAIFSLSGDALDPDEVAARVGLTPFEKGRRGEPRANGWPPFPETFWSHEVLAAADSIDDVITALLDRLEPFQSEILRFVRAPGVESVFLVNVTITRDQPVYSLSPLTLGRLAAFETEVCVDIFDYSE